MHFTTRRLSQWWAAEGALGRAAAWIGSSAAGISVEDQFTVLGASGAVLFTLLSGLLLARVTPARAQAA